MKIRVEVLNKRLNSKLKEALAQFSAIADSLNIELYIVGGLVRDLILKRESLDLDLLLDSKLDVFIDSVQSQLELEVKESAFLTAKVVFNGLTIDIAQARREVYKNNGSLPEVYPSSIGDDAKRRDFTINSLMARVYRGGIVELLNHNQGFQDINKRIIRIIKKGSFYEDPTRIIRALRYKSRFGFKVEKNTLSELREALNLDLYKSLSAQRLGAELLRVFKEDSVSLPIIELSNLNALGFLPAIELDSILKKSLKSWDRFKGKESFQDYFIVPLNIFFEDLSQDSLGAIFDVFELTKYQRKIMIEFKNIDKDKLSNELSKNLKAVDIYDKLDGLDIHSVLSLYSCSLNKRVKSNLIYYLDKISKIRLEITGDDVKSLGFTESPRIGEILKSILRKKILGAVKSKDDEMQALREFLKG